MKYALSWLGWFALATTLVSVDVVTRRLCFSVCEPTGQWFGLSPYANVHFAFSLPLPEWSMYAIYMLAMGAVLWLIWRTWNTTEWQHRLALLLILCGGGANIFERLESGFVRDFLRIGNGYYNVGDVYILAGIAMALCVTRFSVKE